MATEKINESAQETRERLQAAEVKAWIEWDNKQTAAQAQITALIDQGAATDASIEAGRQAAIHENQEKVSEAKTKKAAIEYAWVHELKCPLKRLFADIDKAVAEERTERLVEATNQPEGERTREQIQDLKAETFIHAAQILIEKSLHPRDLVSGSNQRTAAQLVRPDLAAELPSALAQAELAAYADKLQPIYDRQALYYEAARDMEKGGPIDKAGETLKEAISNPGRLGWGVASLIGLGLMYKAFGDYTPNAGLKKWVMGILGVTAFAGGGYMAAKGVDVFNTATGIRTDALFSSAEMKTVRAELEAKMGKDGAVVDDMMRVFDAPIENYSDAYLTALRSHSDGMEKERLLGDNGLSTDEAKFANNKFLKEGGDWLFMECYEMALKEGKTKPLTDAKAKRFAGAEYARTEFAGLKVGSILIALDMVKAGVGVTSSVRESRPGNPHLRELESKVSAFADVLEPTDKPDIYLIYGYPVRYNYTDSGDHVFTDLLGTTAFEKVDQSLTGDGLQNTLLRIAHDAEKAARPLYAAGARVAPNEVRYNNKGSWELYPPRTRATHAGLPPHIIGPTDNVPTIIYLDTADKRVKVALDANGDGVPELRAQPYAGIAEVAEEFEKVKLHERIVLDTSKTLLVPFTVDNYFDAGATTEINISYGGTAKGKLVYSSDKLSSYTLDRESNLTTAWRAQASLKVVEFLGKPQVQAALLRATTKYAGYNQSLFDGMMTRFIGLAKQGINWATSDSITADFASDWEKQVVKDMTKFIYDPVNGMEARYISNMFTGPTPPPATPHAPYNNADFDLAELAFFNTELISLDGTGIVMKTVTPEVLPDHTLQPGQALQMANDPSPKGGQGMIRAALEPLKSQTPATVPGIFNSAWGTLRNAVTNDSVRTAAYEEQVKAFQKELNTAIAGLIVIPAGPVPAGSPALVPTQPTERQVQAEIIRIQAKAQAFAISYTGLNNPDATKKLLLAPVEGKNADWERASGKVVDYVTNNMKWEKWAVMPNPENMMIVLDLWYERLGDPTIAPIAGPIVPPWAAGLTPAQSADAYADYFIWEMQIRMGGHQDFSPEYFYGDVQSVSDTNFKGTITSLRSSVQPYSVWGTAPILKTNPPDMPPTAELERRRMVEYRETKKKEMEAWFAKHGDVGGLFKLDHYWPQVFTQSVNDRLAQIVTDPFATQASLDKDIDDFKAFVWNERYIIFESLILNRVEAERKGYEIRIRILNKMLSYFHAIPRDLAGYQTEMKHQMKIIMGQHHTFPNMPGVPFA